MTEIAHWNWHPAELEHFPVATTSNAAAAITNADCCEAAPLGSSSEPLKDKNGAETNRDIAYISCSDRTRVGTPQE